MFDRLQARHTFRISFVYFIVLASVFFQCLLLKIQGFGIKNLSISSILFFLILGTQWKVDTYPSNGSGKGGSGHSPPPLPPRFQIATKLRY